MLTRVRKIKKLGIFTDYAWDANLPVFGRYNLIYGWNGSGKSTFANFLAGLAIGAVSNYPDLEYEIETNAGGVLKNGTPFTAKIRVFNRVYVASNVHTVSGKAKPILILGEENKRIADEIAADEAVLAEKHTQLKKMEADSSDASTKRNKIVSDIAKTIGLNTSGLAAVRNYRKPDAERDLAALSGKRLLADYELAANTRELKQQEKPDVSEKVMQQLSFDEEEKNIEDLLAVLVKRGKSLCVQAVKSKVVERFRQNPDIAEWVEHGIALHQTHSSNTCEFCDQVLSPRRLGILTAHFNEADKKLKEDIDRLLKALSRAEQSIIDLRLPDKANLYDELQGEYQFAADQFAAATDELLQQVSDFRASIEDKKAKTTESFTLKTGLDCTGLKLSLNAANAKIKEHNSKTKNFKTAKETARKILETHYLSTVYDEVKSLEAKIDENKLKVDMVKNGDARITGDLSVVDLTTRIRNNRAKISSSHKGCEEINSALKTFLGRDELNLKSRRMVMF